MGLGSCMGKNVWVRICLPACRSCFLSIELFILLVIGLSARFMVRDCRLPLYASAFWVHGYTKIIHDIF